MTSPRLPLWITATCDFTRFDDIQTSAGEQAFLNTKGGAIALLTTSRVVYASQNSTLNQAFLRHIFRVPKVNVYALETSCGFPSAMNLWLTIGIN